MKELIVSAEWICHKAMFVFFCKKRSKKTGTYWSGCSGPPNLKGCSVRYYDRLRAKAGFHNSKGLLNGKFTPHCFRHLFTTWQGELAVPEL